MGDFAAGSEWHGRSVSSRSWISAVPFKSNTARRYHTPLRDQGFGLRAGAESELRQGVRQADHGAVLTPQITRAPQSGRWFHDGVVPEVSS
ncbi:hypothetical protein AA309_30535 [Microvirga vignae]|uniref:Uncharacterized protein n=1 Tax=Microvirga vignae TaxID=1225564 RepID=A0A0H1RAE5_9HYPH|nr:hypothetical protein AA309_30535 [Microvirga vignae]